MNEPTLFKPTWTVWTNSAVYGPGFQVKAMWCWAAHGPRGSQSGVEETSDQAVHKAACAMEVLSDTDPARAA